MAADLGTQVGSFVDKSALTAGGTQAFIPQIWSDEIVASYEKNLVLANLVKKISMEGKKGDTIHIPNPTRGSAAPKGEGAAVTLQAHTDEDIQVVLSEHYEYSRLIEDMAEAQALASLRQFYTGDAGYALATQVDTDLMNLGKHLGSGNGSSWAHDASFQIAAADDDSSLSQYDIDGTADIGDFTDTAFRNLIQKMDDADVPMDNRCFVIPPSLRNQIMGIDRYNSSDFVDGRGVQNGQIGTLYGVDVFVSTNCATPESGVRIAQLLHKDTYVLAEQLGVRTQTQYKQEYLGTLFTADTLYGVKTLREDAGFNLAVKG